MKTVLHYTGYDDDGGGITTFIRNLAGGGRFECLLGLNEGAVQHRTPALPVLFLPRVAGERIGPGNFWRARAVARAVQAWLGADGSRVFHGHSRAGLLVGLWLHGLGETRFVVSVHCYGRQRWFYRWAARRLGPRLYWLSPAMRSYYAAPGSGWHRCIAGAVPASRVSPAPPVAGRLRLGGIGALVRWKRWEMVIDALARLPAGADVSFQHIGGDPERLQDELWQLARSKGLGDRIRFCGPEPTSDRLLGEIDVLVVASENEPFSMAMLEALAAGVPVLAADSGGAVDVVRDGVNGRLYRTGDADALVEVLRE
ncbi:MAG TPA: glycosyltransferase family 4 protein, partial [Lacunisphaera sp.]|nr:glycosyltransferase family 4 protein [Lacunisphaera sp.]